MLPTVINAIGLIILGIIGFIRWDTLGINGTPPEGIPSEMLMPVFFGGAFLICVGFSRQHFRHGLYGGLILAMFGVVSALLRIYQYEHFTSLSQAKTQIIAVMATLCLIQLFISWRSVQKDRKPPSPV
jgi:hypothetical protein